MVRINDFEKTEPFPFLSFSGLLACVVDSSFIYHSHSAAGYSVRAVFGTHGAKCTRCLVPTATALVVHSSWDCPGSRPSVLKQAAPLASLEGAEELGLAGFPPVDSTIAALVMAQQVGGLARDPACPNPQCKVTETHLKRVYAAEAQVTRLSNTASVLMAYMDGVLREAPLPEPVATELRLLSSTLLQISGLQGQALGRRLASLIVACRQLWLSQATVPDTDKATQLDAPISPVHTFGPVIEEILQRSHREREASRQVAALLLRGAGQTAGELLRRGLSPEQFQTPRLRWVT
ncbi:UNVERIFIED_CONTAM: hypothetical protein FKN15_038438 [Acipenser sinensis]